MTKGGNYMTQKFEYLISLGRDGKGKIFFIKIPISPPEINYRIDI